MHRLTRYQPPARASDFWLLNFFSHWICMGMPPTPQLAGSPWLVCLRASPALCLGLRGLVIDFWLGVGYYLTAFRSLTMAVWPYKTARDWEVRTIDGSRP